ncbi:MAG TPA: CBS domain-containing protein [Candidatus Limnocylindrales bacterium]|nr:CBS domain-containing protein [Candidatus Limnocylindrales bacterium]
MKTISDIIKDQVPCSVAKDQTVFEVARYMTDCQVGAVPVVEGDRILGIFSERDLMTRVVVKELDPKSTPVGDVMTTDVVVIDTNESYENCIRKMKQLNCRHLPVVSQDRKLIGVISLRDLLWLDKMEKEEELKMLNEYVYGVPVAAT